MSEQTAPALAPLPSVTRDDRAAWTLLHDLAAFLNKLNQIVTCIVWFPVILLQGNLFGYLLVPVWIFAALAGAASLRDSRVPERAPAAGAVAPAAAATAKPQPTHHHNHSRKQVRKQQRNENSDEAGSPAAAASE